MDTGSIQMIRKNKKAEKSTGLNLDVNAEELNDVPPMALGRKRNPNRPYYTMSFRMAHETAELLNKTAADRNTSIQDIVGAAVDKWLRDEKLGYFKKPS